MLNQLIQRTLLTIFLCLPMILNAQVLNISNETILHENINRNAIKVVIAPDSKEVKKEFKDFMDDKFDVKVEGIGFLKNKDVLYTAQRVIPAIASQSMQLSAKIIEVNGQTEMYVFGQFDNNNQISPTKSYAAYAGMKDVTINFLNTLLPDYYKDIVEDQSDLVADLEDSEEDIQKKLEQNRKRIKKLNQENIELEKRLASTRTKLEQNKNELNHKKKTLEVVHEKLGDENQ